MSPACQFVTQSGQHLECSVASEAEIMTRVDQVCPSFYFPSSVRGSCDCCSFTKHKRDA